MATTPNQALNELRRLLKSYEDLKRAETVLVVLSDAENVAKAIEDRKEKASKELSSVSKEYKDTCDLLQVAKDGFKYAEAKIKSSLAEAQIKADAIVSAARSEADDITKASKAEAKAIEEANVTAKRILMQLESCVLIARDKHEAFVSHAATEKARIVASLSTLGSH